MPLALAAALATAATLQPSCSWDRPGANRYTGNVGAALEHYADIPAATRIALKHRIEQGQADEQVQITRDAIRGQREYGADIRDMHFGAGSVCHEVRRSKWDTARVEPGAVYCADEHCILVPRICGNISRITRPVPPQPRAAAAVRPQDGRTYPHALLGDEVPGMELGLADPDDNGEQEMADARERLRYTLDRLAMGGVLAADADAAADDYAVRKRLNGQFGSPFDPWAPFDPAADPLFVPAPVPEPYGWAMLLAGLAVLDVAVRRRGGHQAGHCAGR